MCVFNKAYIGLLDRSLLHMSLNQVELAAFINKTLITLDFKSNETINKA